MLLFTKQITGFLFTGAVLFTACKSSETTPNDSVSLKLNQSGRVGAEVTVRADSIQDSRCPSNANCVWAGQAWVKLLLSKNSDAATVRLALGPDIKEGYTKRLDSTNVSLGNQSYKVILRDVSPYPSLPAKNEAPVATVQVTKL